MLIKIVYNFILAPVIYFAVSILSVFNRRLRLSINARSTIIDKLKQQRIRINPYKITVLFHCSSMGEYKQILPIVKKLTKENNDGFNLILSLYSPSAFENINKDKSPFCVVTYTPFDFYFVTKKFINIINPDIVLISKHDIWPNFIWELKKREVPVYLINGLFADDSKMNEWYSGFFYRSIFSNITAILTINEKNRNRFLNIFPYPEKVIVTGDTRFDAVLDEARSSNKIGDLEFLNNIEKVFVAGSSWPAGEIHVLNAWVRLKSIYKNAFLIVVPHEIGIDRIYKLESLCQEKELKTLVYSESDRNESIDKYDVLIIDKIGILSTLYKYASIAYVGGGFSRSGIHSVLEPAAYKIPVCFGPHLEKSPEAQEMNSLNCGIIFNNDRELFTAVNSLWSDKKLYSKISELSLDFIKNNSGATAKIIKIIKDETAAPKFDKNISLTEEEFERLLNDK
ncbi:MAG: glycosyltransferase N-terminal domain-containing protein [Candidatus Delongbacteria bacterium]